MNVKKIWESVSGGRHQLTAHGEKLKKWLPILSSRKQFLFREGIEIVWHHQWPERAFEKIPIVFFTRDPRDCLYSQYKRENPDLSFSEFVTFPNPSTLLDKAEFLRLFHLCWMDFQEFKVFRFEDYKKDALATLKAILGSVDLSASEREIADAVAASTFEKAAIAEAAYRDGHPEDPERINRSAAIHEWESNPALREGVSHIERVSWDLLEKFGYVAPGVLSPRRPDYSVHFRSVPFFRAMHIDPNLYVSGGTEPESLPFDVCRWAESLSPDLLRRAALSREETIFLMENLGNFSRELSGKYPGNLDLLASQFLGRTALFDTSVVSKSRLIFCGLWGKIFKKDNEMSHGC